MKVPEGLEPKGWRKFPSQKGDKRQVFIRISGRLETPISDQLWTAAWTGNKTTESGMAIYP